jgi:hypothetical protein
VQSNTGHFIGLRALCERWVRWGVLCILVLSVGVVCTLCCLRALERARCATCCHQLRMIGLYLRNYHDLNGTFPPAYLCDKAGKPINSWRAEVVPYFWYNFRPGRDDYAGGRGYNYTEPWNGPKNAKLRLDKHRCEEFQCPSASNQEPAITNYVAVVGPNTMWLGCKPAKPAADGSDNDKILVIEIVNSDILWMEPRDLTLEQALDTICSKKGVGIGSVHPSGINYVTVGGEVRTLPQDIDRESLRKLLVRDSPVGNNFK